MHNLLSIDILPQLLKLYLHSVGTAQHFQYSVTGSLGCAGLVDAYFTYTIRQKQLLRSTLHLSLTALLAFRQQQCC